MASSAASTLQGGTGKFGLEVVGESHYQKALIRARAGARHVNDRLCIDVLIRREPTNKYDADAVQILDPGSGDLLGYLSRDRAKQYRRVLGNCADAGIEVQCAGTLAGEPSIGIWLDLAFPGELAKRLKSM